jgi:ABC-type glycerol-3-phosphate transport system substrate-binding protein
MLSKPHLVRIFVGILVFVSVLLAGCGGGGGSGQSSSNGPVTLTWFMWSGSPQEVDAWKYDASLVTKQYPNIHINFQTADWTNYWTKLETEAASGSLPDIVSLQSLRTAGFASAFRPLDSYIQQSHFDISSFDSGIVKGLTTQGQLRALPYDFGPLVIFYNKALFQKYHVPEPSANWTYADFQQAAQQLTHGNDYGFVASSTPDAWLPFALSDGAKYLTSDGKLDLTNPKLVNEFQNYAKLVYQYHVAPTISVPQATQTPSLWQAGHIAMVADGPWDLINDKATVNFPFGIVPLPRLSQGSVTLTAGSGFGISATSQHPDEAWKAISVLTGADAEQYLASQGRAFSARTAQQQYWYKNAIPGAETTLKQAIPESVPYVTTSNWNQASTLIAQYGVDVLSGRQTAAQALQAVQSQLGGG